MKSEPNFNIKTLRVRIKDRHATSLTELASAVNFVWNFDNDLSFKHTQRTGEFFSAFDLNPYTKGAGKELGLHSQTVQAINEEFVCRRKQFKRAKLRWRVSKGSRRSLGWIPFKAVAIQYRNGQLHYGKLALNLWDSYGLSQYDLGAGSFSEDARGRWYANITVKIPELCGPRLPKQDSVGIDLGLRELAAFSDLALESVQARRFYRDLEPKLATAQRAGKKDRVKTIHAKIANRRKDQLHKLSTRLVKNYGVIVVGNVSSSKLVQTKMAKSVLDSGWSAFKTQLGYKSRWAEAVFKEVNESFSTQDCSACGTRAGPKGLDGLNVERWTCPCCSIEHDRNRNAAVNILLKGLLEIERETTVAGEMRVYEAAMNKDSGAHCTMAGPGIGPLAVEIPVL
jgi:putative transposase